MSTQVHVIKPYYVMHPITLDGRDDYRMGWDLCHWIIVTMSQVSAGDTGLEFISCRPRYFY